MLPSFQVPDHKLTINFELDNVSQGRLSLSGSGNQIEIPSGATQVLTGKQIKDQFSVPVQTLIDMGKLKVKELVEKEAKAPKASKAAKYEKPETPVVENPVVKKAADPAFSKKVKALQEEYKKEDTTPERKAEIKKEINALKKQKASK